MTTGRGQANLAAVAVAVVVLTVVAVVGVAVADDALRRADRDPLERRAAATVADRLVAAGSPTTRGANVLRADRVRNLSASRVERIAPVAGGRAIRVRVGDRTPVDERVTAGTTVERVVTVVRTRRVTRRYDLGAVRNVTVPRGVGRAVLKVRTGRNVSVTSVRANDRPVLHADDGLAGRSTVRLADHAPTRLRFTTNRSRNATVTATVEVVYDRPRTESAVLAVTVDE